MVTKTTEPGRPFGVAVSGSGEVLVSELDGNRLGRYYLPSTVLNPSEVPVGTFPTDVSFSRDGSRAYVSNQLSRSVGFVNTATGIQVDAFGAAGSSFRVLAAPDGLSVWFTNNGGGLFVLDAVTKRALSVALDGAPNGIALSPNAEVLYVSTMDGALYQLNPATLAILAHDSIGGTVQQVAVSPDGTKLYVANESGALEVRNATTLTGITTVPAASGAFDVAVTPDGAQLYVSCARSGRLMVLDATTYVVVKSITGGIPRRIAFDRTGSTAVIANESNYVTFVR